jgi:excinuclease UvrABC nuclease subunit
MANGQQFLFAPEKPLVRRLGQKFFRKIPARPGVYKMRDAQDNVVYVGKAKNLQQRLRSYRVANPERMPRCHLRLVREVTRIEFDLCPNETAALAHESKLIRRLKPKFNRAGVWPGQPQFLTWRFAGQRVEFAVQEVPTIGWERFDSLGAYARRLRETLVRLFWLALHPQCGFSQLPCGWAQGRLGDMVKLDCSERAEEVRAALQNIFWGQPESFAGWLMASVNPNLPAFERAALLADLEEIQEFGLKRKNPGAAPCQMALL